MNILVTGRGGAGSWEIRGRQLGGAMGVTVKPMALLADMRVADVIVAVKRVPPDLLTNIRRSGKPWVYDIVDPYPQPECANWSASESITWLNELIARLKPNRIVWPNDRMRRDADDSGPVVRHHTRPGTRAAPIRETIRTIGYEGAPHYLDGWMHAIGAECERLGAAFLVNPPQLSDLDLVLALRGPKWNGYPQRRWKSAVKLENAHAAGVPFIGMREDGYVEAAVGGEVFVEHVEDLSGAVQMIEPLDVRQRIHESFIATTRTVEQAAAEMVCALRF